MRYVTGCLGCEIAAGRCEVPGGIVAQTPHWIVNHAVGRLNLGTLMTTGEPPDPDDIERFCGDARQRFGSQPR